MNKERSRREGVWPGANRALFARIGGAWHLRLQVPGDLSHAVSLEPPHWAVLLAPVDSLPLDPVLLAWLDSNQDGKIGVGEFKHAIQWFLDHLNPSALSRAAGGTLVREEIRKEGPDAGAILSALRAFHAGTGETVQDQVELAAVRQMQQQVEVGGMDQPGMVLPEAADSPDLCQFLKDVMTSVGGEPHGGDGKSGVMLRNLDRFERELEDYLDWLDEATLPSDGERLSPVMPLGEATVTAFDALLSIEDKLDEFFLQCDLVRFGLEGDPAASSASVSACKPGERLRHAPLAEPNPKGRLLLQGLINPAFQDALMAFRDAVLMPLYGGRPESLEADQWQEVKRRFLLHRQWRNQRPRVRVDALPEERLHRYHEEPAFGMEARRLIEASYRTAQDLANLRQLERLLLHRAHLLSLARSFVSFQDLYDPGNHALFDMGTLYLNGCEFGFTVRITDRQRHVRFARAGGVFMLYARVHQNPAACYEVAVPVTAPAGSHLQAGAWGWFRDRQGLEHPAEVVEVAPHPVGWIRAGIQSMSLLWGTPAARDSDPVVASETTGSTWDSTGSQAQDRPTITPHVRSTRPVLGGRRGAAVALAALGASLAYGIQILAGLSWPMRIAIVAGPVAVGVSVVLGCAWLGLRKRDLRVVLEGAGWGVNCRMRLSRSLARRFTRRPDPARTSGGVWWILFGLLALLAGLALYSLR